MNDRNKYTRKQIEPFKNKPVLLIYFWDGAKNHIPGVIEQVHYKVRMRLIGSNMKVNTRYGQIYSIEELSPKIALKMLKELIKNNSTDHALRLAKELMLIFPDEKGFVEYTKC